MASIQGKGVNNLRKVRVSASFSLYFSFRFVWRTTRPATGVSRVCTTPMHVLRNIAPDLFYSSFASLAYASAPPPSPPSLPPLQTDKTAIEHAGSLAAIGIVGAGVAGAATTAADVSAAQATAATDEPTSAGGGGGGGDLASALAAALSQRKGNMGESDDEEESDDDW